MVYSNSHRSIALLIVFLHQSHVFHSSFICLIICYSIGGHTTEMLHLIAEMDPKRYTKFEFLIAETDKQSINQLNDAKVFFMMILLY